MNYIQKNFNKWTPVVQHYQNGRIAIEYTSENPEYGQEQECIATINIPDEPLEKDEVIIKNYSEGEGLYEEMIKAKHISEAIREVHSGFITASVCKLLLPH